MKTNVSLLSSGGQLQLVPGNIQNEAVSVLRDSGATIIRVYKEFVLEPDMTGKIVPCFQFSGTLENMPIAQIHIDTPFLSSKAKTVVGAFPGADLIIGNVLGVMSPTNEDIQNWHALKLVQLGTVQTRAMSSKTEPKPLKIKSVPLDTSPEELKKIQAEDQSLRLCFQNAQTGKEKMFKFSSAKYIIKNGLLYRQYKRNSQEQDQLVIPSLLGPSVLKLAHDVPVAGHMDKGNRYILTIVDSARRWPEAIPLRNITTMAVAEAIFCAFSRLGLPKQVMSDRGTQFMFELMKELFKLFGMQPINTSPYHPANNGMCERLNGTLKTMLRKVEEDRPKDWDRYLPAVLFAYREVRQ
ncbi:Gypsy retrotransposon integrase-like protein 1 [Elysia marginata]|uniref:Gypsy retrotransposon integrase-like protein 1 n=1 Tax=Elysia marginata TaxID=1093978 RepID=A0AAV4FJG6_9GAST|nr:Gypsy retrotransposon integrase-like protein 1 [Elysia marginata]